MIIKIELDTQAATAVAEIESITGLGVSAILSNGLSLLLWAVRQHQDGRVIASMDESLHRFRELEVPSFSQVAGRKNTSARSVA